MSTTAPRPRVVVADDSALMRRVVCNLLARGGIEVVGAAKDGDEALALCEREQPDAMALDLAMPGLGGIDVLRELRRRSGASGVGEGGEVGGVGGIPIPVVVVSAFSPSQGARAVDALAEGAFELVPKPGGAADVEAFQHTLLGKIRLAVQTRRSADPRRREPAGDDRRPLRPARHALSRALLIVTSTGGPRALSALIPALPSPLGLGTLIVQHMPAGFTASLAARLDRSSSLAVREAQGGESLEPGVALVAPGGRHLRLDPDRQTMLSDDAPLGGLRPRADLLISDMAAAWGTRLTLVVLTGMGNDGLEGAQEVRRHGGRILVEAESTCTVYGMPRAIADAGLADAVLPLDEMATTITAEVG